MCILIYLFKLAVTGILIFFDIKTFTIFYIYLLTVIQGIKSILSISVAGACDTKIFQSSFGIVSATFSNQS